MHSYTDKTYLALEENYFSISGKAASKIAAFKNFIATL